MSEHQPTHLGKSAKHTWFGEFVATAGCIGLCSFGAYADAFTAGDLGRLGRAVSMGVGSALILSALAPWAPGLANPAFVVALWLIGRVQFVGAMGMIAAQTLGSILGALAARAIFSPRTLVLAEFAMPRRHPQFSIWHGMWIDLFASALLVWIVLGAGLASAALRSRLEGLAAGLWFGVVYLVSSGIAGCYGNPLAWFGPALLAIDLRGAAAFLWGPFLGASIAAAGYNVTFAKRCEHPT